MNPHYDRAMLYLQSGRYQQAEAELGQILVEHPDDEVALAMLALCRLRQEDRDGAEELIERAIHLDPTSGFLHFVRGEILLDRRRYDDARAAVAESLEWDPDHLASWLLAARIDASQQRWSDVLTNVERALEIDPEDEDARGLKSFALAQLGRKDEARAAAEEALAAAPESSFARSAAGWSALHAGRAPEAVEHFSEALRLDPTNDGARAGLIEAIKAQNVLYRWFLGGMLWMQRIGSRWATGLILGLWLGMRVLANLEADHPEHAWWIGPLRYLYIGFVLLTWLGVPMSNLALRLHPVGRHALSREERVAANWSGVLVFAALGSALAAVITSPGGFGALALFFFLMLFPVLGTFNCEKGWPRYLMAALSVLVALFGLLGVAIAFDVGHLTNGFTLFIYGAVGMSFLALFLGRVEPKR